VLPIYRKEAYLASEGRKVPDEDVGVAQLIVAKNRFGPVMDIKLRFLKERGLFGSAARA
jgi:replicative DNA helicase